MAKIVIKTDAALTDAKRVESIIQNIDNYMQQLNKGLNDELGVTICTNWAYKVLADWREVYSKDVPNVMANMKLTATNIKAEVEAYQEYSTQE